MKALMMSAAVLLVGGCSLFAPLDTRSLGEQASGYTYIPLDPFAVKLDANAGGSCQDASTLFGTSSMTSKHQALLAALPDLAVRMSVVSKSAKGEVTYGVGATTAEGSRYKVTVDYINADTTNVSLLIRRTVPFREKSKDGYSRWRLASLTEPLDPWEFDLRNQYYEVKKAPSATEAVKTGGRGEGATAPVQGGAATVRSEDDGFYEYTIPVYVGLGLRVTADVKDAKAGTSLTGLSAIGVAAEAKHLSGSLIVQTLGINGKSVSAALPINNDLNMTTTQNAVSAIGAIKALLYEDGTETSPRVVGLYLPFPGGEALVNAIIGVLAKDRVEWRYPCVLQAGPKAMPDRRDESASVVPEGENDPAEDGQAGAETPSGGQ